MNIEQQCSKDLQQKHDLKVAKLQVRGGGGGCVQKLPRFPCYLSDPSGENFCKESLLQQLGGALVENLSKERLLQRLVEHW